MDNHPCSCWLSQQYSMPYLKYMQTVSSSGHESLGDQHTFDGAVSCLTSTSALTLLSSRVNLSGWNCSRKFRNLRASMATISVHLLCHRSLWEPNNKSYFFLPSLDIHSSNLVFNFWDYLSQWKETNIYTIPESQILL